METGDQKGDLLWGLWERYTGKKMSPFFYLWTFSAQENWGEATTVDNWGDWSNMQANTMRRILWKDGKNLVLDGQSWDSEFNQP